MSLLLSKILIWESFNTDMKKLLLLFLLFPTLSIAESYLCIAEAAGGVLYDGSTDKFNGTSFSTDSKIYCKKKSYI